VRIVPRTPRCASDHRSFDHAVFSLVIGLSCLRQKFFQRKH
jgi:hypothetical protein